MQFRSHLLPILCLLPTLSYGQQGSTVGIYGTIQDPQHSPVPQATVSAIQIETGRTRTTVTNAAGQYTLDLLPVGAFRLTVAHPGFARYERTGLQLQINDNIKADVTLQLSSVTTTVEVNEGAEMVQTRDALVREVVDARRVADLPLNGRVLADLAALAPGVVPANGAQSTQTGNQGNGYKGALNTRQFMINGARPNETAYTLDGGDNNDIMYNVGLPAPFPDATQEFSIQTAGQGVDIGHSVGGTMNVVTKSGSNSLHGGGFWFLRNTALNANNFFSKTPDNLKRNQGGGTLGGPILKNRLFIFGGVERNWVRQINGANSTTTMPALHRTGNFSDVKTAILDPTTGKAFPGNIIPATRLSPAILKLLEWQPAPNSGTKYVYPTYNQVDIDQEVVRVDYQFNDKNLFYGRFFRQNGVNWYPAVGQNMFSVKNGGWMIDDNATIAWTFIVNPRLTSDAHFTGFYGPAERTLNCVWGDILKFGVDINPRSCEVSISMTGSNTVSLASSSRTAPFRRGNLALTNSWRYARGSHSLVFGGDLRWSRYNMYNPFHGSGVFTFSGASSGYGQADVMMGSLYSFLQGNGTLEFRRQRYRALYAGDSFRATRRLTLNLGLRWEPFSFVSDVRNRNVQFRQDLYAKGWVSQMWHNSPPGLIYPGDVVDGNTVSQTATDMTKLLFAPRVGFAWDVAGNGKLSVRGGYGLYYSTPETYLLNGMTNQAPFGYDQTLLGGSFDAPYRGRENLNVFPLKDSFTNPNMPFPAGQTLTYALEPKYNVPSTNSWNLMIERQLGDSWLARAGYVGSRTNHLPNTYDINVPVYNTSQTLLQNQGTIDQRRPRPQFSNLYVLCSCLPSNYHALQLTLNRRFSRGLSLLTNYTWSKALDYVSDGMDVQTAISALYNPYNPLAYRGPADWNVPYRFVESAVYKIPDAGKRLGWMPLSMVTRGWTLAGTLTVQGGRPFSLTTSGDVTAGAGTAMAVQTGPVTLDGQSRGQQIAQYFNTANVAAATANTRGTTGRNRMQGPGFRNLDTSIYRDVALRESMFLSFRFEAFNATNRVNLSNPTGSVGSATFGQISSIVGEPRILQFALKLRF